MSRRLEGIPGFVRRVLGRAMAQSLAHPPGEAVHGLVGMVWPSKNVPEPFGSILDPCCDDSAWSTSWTRQITSDSPRP